MKFKTIFTNILLTSVILLLSGITLAYSAEVQMPAMEFNIDTKGNTVILPNLFKPSVDLSGRGFHKDASYPQNLSAPEPIDTWKREVGFRGPYRIQYNLWEISQLSHNKEEQKKLLDNYENLIKTISDSGGFVILDIFGTPAGMGRALDKISAPVNLKAFKNFIKAQIRELSCKKKYNIWYEVWSAPDLDDFFLGRKQDYLNLYRTVAQVILELRDETKLYIPVGGPSTSWWFQNLDANTIVRPEKSLIYELIRFCSRYKLPLDFISWHAYSTDPKADKETTIYNKKSVTLIRDWLSYFNMNKNTPLVITEWNYDRGTNIAQERGDRAYIASSYMVARIKNMYEAGLDYQVLFSMEDFRNKEEDISRNVGVFWLNPSFSGYKGGAKATYNIFRMLSMLNSYLIIPQNNVEDDFVGILATQSQANIALIAYNYIDPDAGRNYISRNISTLNPKDRKSLLSLIKSDQLDKILAKESDLNSMQFSAKLKNFLKKAQELNTSAKLAAVDKRTARVSIKNIKGEYSYKKYVIDDTHFKAVDFQTDGIKDVSLGGSYEEELSLAPYSVQMILLEKKSDNTTQNN